MCGMRWRTYNGYLSAELILDFTLLVGIRTFILDDLEELFDTHLGGGCRSVSLQFFDDLGGKFRCEVTRCSRLLRETALSGTEAKFYASQYLARTSFITFKLNIQCKIYSSS
jgi:hypothetical protein